jgi:hypothetical protein
MKYNLQNKLGAWALISLVMILPFEVGCSAKSVAQNIVNWTPTIISAAQTVDATVATLDPAQAALIESVGVAFTAGANLLAAQAQTYLNNPTIPILQQLQAQALSFQKNVNTALLAAAHVTNSVSQQRILAGLNAAVTGVSAVLALIMTIKGNTLTPQLVQAQTQLAEVLPLLNHGQDVALVAEHYGEPFSVAEGQVRRTQQMLMGD